MQSCKDLRIVIPKSYILVHIVLSADAPGTSRCSVPLAASYPGAARCAHRYLSWPKLRPCHHPCRRHCSRRKAIGETSFLRHEICSGMHLLISQVQGISVFRCAAAGKTILGNIDGKSHTATFIGCINLAG